MTQMAKEIVDWLEGRAFNAVLRANPEEYPPSKRDKLKELQERTRAEVERLRSCSSAREVVTTFERDLRSAPARKTDRELEDLGLPAPHAIKDEFEDFVYRLSTNG